MIFRTAGILAGLLLVAARAEAQLPSTGYVSSFGGVSLSGQCVPNARKLGDVFVRKTLPYLGSNGVAADLWNNYGGFQRINRISNGNVKMPPKFAFIIWSKSLGGTGHVAMVVGSVDGTKKIVRVVDTNWDNRGSGMIHDVNLNDSRILGYLVP